MHLKLKGSTYGDLKTTKSRQVIKNAGKAAGIIEAKEKIWRSVDSSLDLYP